MKHTTLVVLACLMALAGTAAADETTLCNTFITTLPFTISTQGHYCFNKNLSTAITSGNAITINADFVVLDLNNFKLGGGSAGLGTNTNGIFANNRRNITVRNGNIRGFRIGVNLDGDTTASGNHVVENNVLDGNTVMGMHVIGDTLIVRNNLVSNTGANTLGEYPTAMYVYGSYYLVSAVRDNVVTGVFDASVPTDYTIGFNGNGYLTIDRNSLSVFGSSATRRCMHVDSGYLRDNLCLGQTDAYAFFHAAALIIGNYPAQ